MKQKITSLRKKRGLTVEALADMVGVSKSHMSELINGKKRMSDVYIRQLSIALDVPIYELMSDSDDNAEIVQLVRDLEQIDPEGRKAIIAHARALRAARDETAD